MEQWIEHITHYLVWMTAKGDRPGTIRLRRSYLMRLAQFSGVGPWDVQPGQLLAFIGTVGASPESKRSARTAAANFYRWAMEEDLVTLNPAKRLPTVRVPRGTKKKATPDPVLEHALQIANGPERLMIKLARYAGLRRVEIAPVRGADLDDDDMLTVVGKGGHTRRVPIADMELLSAFRSAGDAYLFPGNQDGHIGADWVGKLLSRLLGPGWAGHSLRHACFTKGFKGTKNIRAAQLIAGHASVTTTQIYIGVDDDELFDFVRAAA